MLNATFSRARWIGAFSVLTLAACGSGQTNPKSSDTTDATAKTESAAKTEATPPVEKKAEVAGETPTKSGSGSNEVAGAKPYQLTRFEIERPPFAYTLKTAVKVDAGAAPTLTKASEKKAKITDAADWFDKNKLSLAGRMPSKIGPIYPMVPDGGADITEVQKLHYVLDHGNHYVLMFGENFAEMTELAVYDKGQSPRAIYSFKSFVKPPEIVAGEEQFTNMEVLWAQKVDDVLYVSSGHHSYAKSSKGKNAFVSAIDIKSGTLRWQSEPLVCNSVNFVVQGGYIICGYGFTKEDDFLYVISRADGKTVSKTKLAHGPTYLVMKGNQLFVLAYDTEYVFDVK